MSIATSFADISHVHFYAAASRRRTAPPQAPPPRRRQVQTAASSADRRSRVLQQVAAVESSLSRLDQVWLWWYVVVVQAVVKFHWTDLYLGSVWPAFLSPHTQCLIHRLAVWPSVCCRHPRCRWLRWCVSGRLRPPAVRRSSACRRPPPQLSVLATIAVTAVTAAATAAARVRTRFVSPASSRAAPRSKRRCGGATPATSSLRRCPRPQPAQQQPPLCACVKARNVQRQAAQRCLRSFPRCRVSRRRCPASA